MRNYDGTPNGFGAPEEDGTNSAPLPLPFNEVPNRREWQLKAIPTPYKGCRFRSRLEAKWAVFFDALEIEWRYEHEGFILSPFGECYLPDFYLPELGYWIEVNPAFPNEEAQRKAYLFNYGRAVDNDPVKSRERAYILYGDIPWPYPREGNIIGYAVNQGVSEGQTSDRTWGMVGDLCWQLCPICQQIMIGRIKTMACHDCFGELSTLLEDALDCVEGIPVFDKVIDIVPAMVSGAINTDFFRSGAKMPMLRDAYTAASSAQFEGKRYRRPA